MEPNAPLFLVELFPTLDARLIDLLRDLSDDDWHRPTICSQWSVKDIAAHLLDGNVRRLSICRDGFTGVSPDDASSYDGLVAFLNRLNAEWVTAMRRVSPRILIEDLERTCREVYDYFRGLDPFGDAHFAVAWAGEEQSANWFDIARDYTEHWLHQQQIRLAVGVPGIETRELYAPVLETFMRALPHTYRDVAAEEGTVVSVRVTGDAGGVWSIVRRGDAWQSTNAYNGESRAEVIIDQEIAWRLFSKGIDREHARSAIAMRGDESLGGVLLGMLSVMA